MKKHLLAVFFFIGSWFYGSAQWVSIPDTNFVNYLQGAFPSCINGNLLDTNATLLVNPATIFDCRYHQIHDLTGIRYFKTLLNINCENNLLTFLPLLPDSLIGLYARNNDIAYITAFPEKLEYADFYNNNLSSLPPSYNKLETLILTFNQFTTLPPVTNSLRLLNLTFNQVDSLLVLPASLRFFYCPNNKIKYISSLPDSLEVLDCSFNQLPSLPTIPDSVIYLYCTYNQLTSFPALGDSLKWLEIDSNLISQVPVLPNGLEVLSCALNPLQPIANLPPNLKSFNCSNTHLTSLPPLPSTLTKLSCINNQLTGIDSFPSKLKEINVSYNNLMALPTLPDTVIELDCRNNPNLTCLPFLTRINSFNFTGTGVGCLPNYGSVGFSSPSVAAIPLCGIFNTNQCQFYWNIAGHIYLDTIMNCTYDATENSFDNIKVQLYENGVLLLQTTSLYGGKYAFDTDLSTYQYTIDTSNLPFTVACPDTGYYTSVITAADILDTAMNFGLQCKPGFDLAAQNVSGRFRPADTRQLNISAGDFSNFYNTHCATGISGSVQLVMNGSVTYISPASGALAPSNVSGDTVTWNIPDFGVVNFFSDFNIMLQTDTNAQLGSLVCFSLVVNPIAGDNNPSNNALDYCGVVVGSFDPNEKEVYPIGNIDASDWLTYTIHFQNTGTDTAQHIYVTDTLDSDVDASSFQLLAYSHQPMVQIKENAVRFNFPNINLPDSNTNEPLSHGYVQYKVKLKDNLPVGTNISNTAFIYFDFNAPVVTNTTTNTIALATGVSDVRDAIFDVRLFPNPAGDFVNITVDQAMAKSKLTITDITGRKITVAQIENRVSHIETSAYPNGIYFVTVENERGRVTRKLIIQK